MSIRHCIAGVVLVALGGLAVNGYQSPLDERAITGDELLAAMQNRPNATPPVNKPVPLAVVVQQLNQKAQEDHIGKTQPPLTEDEVIASIRAWLRENIRASDEVYATYQKIAESRMIPANATLEVTTRYYGNRGFDFDVWWVDLGIMTGPTTGFAFRIRDQKIRTRERTSSEDKLSLETVATTTGTLPGGTTTETPTKEIRKDGRDVPVPEIPNIVTAPSSSPVGRYQYVAHTNFGVIIDTTTGHCWSQSDGQWKDLGTPKTPPADVKLSEAPPQDARVPDSNYTIPSQR